VDDETAGPDAAQRQRERDEGDGKRQRERQATGDHPDLCLSLKETKKIFSTIFNRGLEVPVPVPV